jgi:HK97 family phage major capsid protein
MHHTPTAVRAALDATIAESTALLERVRARSDELMTPAETQRGKQLIADITTLKANLKRAEDNEGLNRVFDDLGRQLGAGPPRAFESGYDGELRPGAAGESEHGAKAWSAEVLRQVRGEGSKDLAVTGPIALASPVLEPVRDPERPRYIADLIPAEAVTGPTVTFWRQTLRDLNAAPWAYPSVATGVNPKPESNLGLTAVDADVTTIAHIVPDVRKADLADNRALAGFVQGEMYLGLRLAVDEQIILGTGIAPELEGLSAVSGVQSQPFATNVLTTLRKARTKLELENFVPDALVISPTDAEALDLTVDGQSRFYFARPQQSGADPVWSVRTVTSPVVPNGTAWMGDFGNGARIFSREQATLEMDPYSRFSENLITFRAELRMAFGVLRPKAFVEVHLTA